MNHPEEGGADLNDTPDSTNGNGAAPKTKKKRMKRKGRLPQVTKNEKEREVLTTKVISMFAMGSTIDEISQTLKVSEGMVRRVIDALPPEYLELLNSAKTNEIAQLIEQNIREGLESMIRITRVTNDDVWLKTQRAPELGTLYGIISDKTVRILAAIERSNERERTQRLSQAETGLAEEQLPGSAGRPQEAHQTVGT